MCEKLGRHVASLVCGSVGKQVGDQMSKYVGNKRVTWNCCSKIKKKLLKSERRDGGNRFSSLSVSLSKRCFTAQVRTSQKSSWGWGGEGCFANKMFESFELTTFTGGRLCIFLIFYYASAHEFSIYLYVTLQTLCYL